MAIDSLYEDLQEARTAICVVGLGYVGLPLACRLAKKFKVLGFDISEPRIAELREGIDRTKEVESKEDLINPNIVYSSDPKCIAESRLVIVAVPTPVDEYKKPDLTPLQKASETVSKHLKPGTIVVYESTVFPGVTEDYCGAILEKETGLTSGKDFFLGYSPERINPGDKVHTVEKIVKVVSGQTEQVCDILAKVYSDIIVAGVHKAPNIRTAEAAKVIENTQRDINIALVNELAMIFDEIGLDTHEVLSAAGTKWNFLPFTPGLVGGHCIGVDPYYLTYLADKIGFHSQMISSGRRINDSVSKFVTKKIMTMLLSSGANFNGSPKIGVFGVTFKENIPDIRNTKIVEVADQLEQSACSIFCHDPMADAEEVQHEYQRKLHSIDELPVLDAAIVAVSHTEFKETLTLERLAAMLNPKCRIVIDLKGVYSSKKAEELGISLWRL
jgi:UDP-N-acetyl-D-galactosamine dehydrogenase